MMDYEKLYQERKQRVETAIANKEPDRIPNVFSPGDYPIHRAGLTMAESMIDHEKACEAMLDFYKTYAYTDVASPSNFYPAAKTLENLGSKTARWPGDPKGLDVNNAYQFIEFPTLLEDEYGELLDSPAGFWLSKHLPRVFEVFEDMGRLEDVDYYSLICNGATQFLTSAKAIPVYKRLLAAAEENQKMNETVERYAKKLRDLGYYSTAGIPSATAFDLIGDTLRGTFGLMPDLIENPEDVKRTLEAFCKVHIRESVKFCKETGCRYAWVMLHKGFDNFISDECYGEFYWPYLQKWILALIENDITPYVYTEGLYDTRIKYLKDVPADKVVYHFEKGNMKMIKKELGDIACITGGFAATTVHYGTPKQIDEEIKELLYTMAPGGGYMFCTGYALDDAPRENIEAMFEAVDQYGKY